MLSSGARLSSSGGANLLIHSQDHHELSEESYEIQEEVNAVPDIIFISIFSLFNNELSIKKDKATHDHQPHIQVCLAKEE